MSGVFVEDPGDAYLIKKNALQAIAAHLILISGSFLQFISFLYNSRWVNNGNLGARSTDLRRTVSRNKNAELVTLKVTCFTELSLQGKIHGESRLLAFIYQDACCIPVVQKQFALEEFCPWISAYSYSRRRSTGSV